MAETSYFWTTNGTGDGASAKYSRSDLATAHKVLAGCAGYQGVAPNYLNALVGTVPSANTVSINTGGAIVDGIPYKNGAAVSVNIPSASGAGNTRIDRIVLRASWAAQTVRITRIAGTDAASPSAPSVTTTSETTYDIMLYQARVTTAGVVTLTDERQFAGGTVDNSTIEVSSAGALRVKDDGVTTAKLNSGVPDGNTLEISGGHLQVKNSGITKAKLENSTAQSVLGRAGITNGAVADISVGNVAATDGYALIKKAGGSLLFGTLITKSYGDDTVDYTKVGYGVHKIVQRQGNSATSWVGSGTTTYALTSKNITEQVGRISGSGTSTYGTITVTFPSAFAYAPLPIVAPYATQTILQNLNWGILGSSATGLDIYWHTQDGSLLDSSLLSFVWRAIGEE